jgi:small-conductance mechanosensitive channel
VGGTAIAARFGLDMKEVMAGLGIGSVAVAFGMKQIIEDTCLTMILLVRRPFNVGDSIDCKLTGFATVTNITFLKTEARLLDGQLVTVPNAQLSKCPIENHSLRQSRRMKFTFAVALDTTAEQLAALPAIVEKQFDGLPETAGEEKARWKAEIQFDYAFVTNALDYGFEVTVQFHVSPTVPLALCGAWFVGGALLAPAAGVVYASLLCVHPPVAGQEW